MDDRGSSPNGRDTDSGSNGKPRSTVHALLALGLSEFDAWRCVHAMQGRNGMVLVQMQDEDTGEPCAAAPGLHIDAEQIAAAESEGAAWSKNASGQWQYLRRMDWCVARLSELHEELTHFTLALKQRRAGGSRG